MINPGFEFVPGKGYVPKRVIPAADKDDAMRDQLEFLIEQHDGGNCGCDICQRYSRVEAELLSLFVPATTRRWLIARARL